MKYDYLIVGAGLFGSICAYELNKKGKKVLVIDKREHIGGNIYTELKDDIIIHKYGAHIFHTNKKEIWEYVNNLVEFNNYINSPIAIYNNEVYNLPFNMNTFSKMWGDVITPEDALRHIEEERKEITNEPHNLEEQAISLVGRTIYEKLVKGYTEKQWNKDCKELPSFIIKRLPVRFTYDNNYFNDRFQGIPINGYTELISKLLENVEVRLNMEYKEEYKDLANKIIYTGRIDEYYKYCYGKLEYRSLYFDTEKIYKSNYQGNAVVNYTHRDIPYTRIIEHKHFSKDNKDLDYTYITREYPVINEKEPYYPINNEENDKIYYQYEMLAKNDKNIVFGGRLGLYKYLDMDKVIEKALELCNNLK